MADCETGLRTFILEPSEVIAACYLQKQIEFIHTNTHTDLILSVLKLVDTACARPAFDQHLARGAAATHPSDQIHHWISYFARST